MERKLVKQGNSALTVTLPSKWIKKFDLTQNDFILIEEYQNNLLIKSRENNKIKKINILAKDQNQKLIYRQIMGKYIEGFDEIQVDHNNIKLIEKISNDFIGLIPEKITNDTLILKNIIKNPQDNFKELFQRVSQQLIDLTRSLKNDNLKEIEFKELILNKNITYLLRYINKYESVDNKFKQFLLITTLESVADIIVEIAELNFEIQNNKIKEEKYDDLVNLIEYYILYLHQNNIVKLHKHLQEHKNKVKKESFEDGLIFSIIENLNNYVGFI